VHHVVVAVDIEDVEVSARVLDRGEALVDAVESVEKPV
jgi:hypothetical protein